MEFQTTTLERMYTKQNPGQSLALRGPVSLWAYPVITSPASECIIGIGILGCWRNPHLEFSFKPNQSYHNEEGEMGASETTPLHPHPPFPHPFTSPG